MVCWKMYNFLGATLYPYLLKDAGRDVMMCSQLTHGTTTMNLFATKAVQVQYKTYGIYMYDSFRIRCVRAW